MVVNYAGHPGQCYVGLPWKDLAGQTWRLRDRLGTAVYERNGDDLSARGLYLDMTPWEYHAFDVDPV